MNTKTNNWKKPAKTGLKIAAFIGLSRGLLIAGYAFFLAIQARGEPNADLINQFADQSQLFGVGASIFLVLSFSIGSTAINRGE